MKKGKLLLDRVNASLYAGWIDGNYQFNETSIDEIKDLLAFHFNCPVMIECQECFKNISLTGRIFAADKQTLLNILAAMLPAQIQQKDNTILIKPK